MNHALFLLQIKSKDNYQVGDKLFFISIKNEIKGQ